MEPAVTPAVLILGLFMLVTSSASSEMLSIYLHARIPLAAIVQTMLILAFVTTGNHSVFMKTPFSRWYLLLGAWWLVTGLFGSYPRASVTMMGTYLFRLHSIPFVIAAIAASASRVRFVMTCFATGYLAVLVYCFLWGNANNAEARFLIPDTSLANPNDLAMHLVMGAAFLVVMLGNKLLRVLVPLALPVLAYYVLKTGSRSILLSIVLVFLVLMVVLPSVQRTRLLAGGVLAFALIIPLMPRETWNRLFTFSDVDYEDAGSRKDVENARRAVGSTMARTELQRRALLLTLYNPVFGVGPGQFAPSVDEMVREATGRKSTWQASHNTYLQVSAESGVPGLILFLISVAMLARSCLRSYKLTLQYPQLAEYSLQSLALLMVATIYIFYISFASIAYGIYLPVLVGFAAANQIGLAKLIPGGAVPQQQRGATGRSRPPMPPSGRRFRPLQPAPDRA